MPYCLCKKSCTVVLCLLLTMPPFESTKPPSPTNHVETPKITDDIVLVDDKLYSWKKLAANHPGGDIFVKAFAGRDATEAFMSYHRRLFPHSLMAHAVVDTTPTLTNENYTADYLELCALVEEVLPKHKSFAPPIYFVKLFVLLTFTVGLEFYVHYTHSYCWYLCGLLGWCFALIGLNIQHDANHGSISKNAKVNRILGLTQNWIGGSAIDWIHQHVVQHHIYVNDLHEDPDIMGSIALRLNPLRPLVAHQKYQFLYAFIMIAFFGFSVIITSLKHVVTRRNYSLMSKQFESHIPFEICTSIVFICRWAVYPLLSTYMKGGNVLLTFLNIAPMYAVGGYYLALFFLISHNFEGVTVFDHDKCYKNVSSKENESASTGASYERKYMTRSASKQKVLNELNGGDTNTKHPLETSSNRFLYRQVVTASNVGGPWLAFLNGGLNYQIEHHLFPRVQHSHYATIAPIVRAYCDKKNIPYIHFPTISENVLACATHLFKMGNSMNTQIIRD